MIRLHLPDRTLTCSPNESVLETLLREGVEISYSCQQGACQSCMIQATNVTAVPHEAQKGLKDTLQNQGYFLACQCYPTQDLTLKLLHHEDFYTNGRIITKTPLNAETLLLRIACDDEMDYFAGQFVNLRRDSDGLTRSYSIANTEWHARELEFHIRRLPGGRFTGWVHDELNIGDSVGVSAPQGACYYLPGRPEQNLLLVGTGSGLAPLAGILMDALRQNHRGLIHLFHGSRERDGLYWIDEMRALTEQYPNFRYTPCLSRSTTSESFAMGRANEVACATYPDMKGWRLYLCGHPDMVAQMKRQAFLQGVSLADIYADAFHIASSAR